MGNGEFIRPTVVGHPHGYELPDLPLTPIDEMSGLPWCFAPNLDLSPPPRGANYARKGEWNHMFPRVEVVYSDNPALEGLGRMALLNLRHQWVEFNDHHYGYNPNFIGPKQPATARRLAGTLVFGLAHFVPEYAISFKGDKPKARRLTVEERLWYWESGQLKVADEGSVVSCLSEYVLSQEADHIHPNEIEEFLHTFNTERRIHLGHRLAAKMIERAIEPFEPMYAKARKQDLLMTFDMQTHELRPPSRNPRDLVKQKLTSGRKFGRFESELRRRLGAHNRQRKQGLVLPAAV